MKRLKCALVFVVLFAGFLAQAHEFWMEPTKFLFKVGEKMEMDFMAGENFAGEPWGMQLDRIVKMDHYFGSRSEDMVPTLSVQDKKVSAVLTIEGTHLFSMRSNNAFIELEAEAFNAYLKEDGLDEALQAREKNHMLDKPGKENYARCTKLLVQVGDKRDETFKIEVGLPLEIIPLQNPYEKELTDEVKFKVLFQGKPLAFTLVKVWNRGDGETFIQNIYTEKDGTITTRLSNKGVWMVTTVKIIQSRQPGADWQSFWSSLVFGFN
jgi:uncharacterized GH25 family protein